MKVTIEGADAIRGLRHAVATRGASYVYQAPGPGADVCVYAWPDDTGTIAPSCIVGMALEHLGVPLDLIIAQGNAETIPGVARGLSLYGYVFSHPAIAVLHVAQLAQDKRRDWGQALDAAEKEILNWKTPPGPPQGPPHAE